jgi:hypothetical protein
MVWWIVGAVIVLPLLLLAATLAGLRRRLVEMDRVAALGQERMAEVQPRLLAASERLQATLADLERRSATVQRRLAAIKAKRAAD